MDGQAKSTLTEQMTDDILQTWAIHNRIHLYLLDGIPDDALKASMSPRGRTVYDLFGHVHNVRLMWLKSAGPHLLPDLHKIEPKVIGTREQVGAALTASGVAIAALVRQCLASGGTVKGFRPHACAFIGYLISHESHHRGQIEFALRLAGKPLHDSISYGLWEWGTR